MTRSADEKWVPEETFGDRLRRVRRSLHLSQEAFAHALGPDYTSKALGAWEAGTREPRGAVALAKRIELAFNVPATWILGLDSGPVPPPTPPGEAADASIVPKHVELVAA